MKVIVYIVVLVLILKKRCGHAPTVFRFSFHPNTKISSVKSPAEVIVMQDCWFALTHGWPPLLYSIFLQLRWII